MDTAPLHRIFTGRGEAPPPPLTGALAAWLTSRGLVHRVVDPRGAAIDWRGEGPLWVHLDTNTSEETLAALPTSEPDLRFIGPAAREGGLQYPDAQLLYSDPEGRVEDLDSLPIATYAGFGRLDGGIFRILAGRYDRCRSVPHLLREIVYLVETFQAGHLVFDDEDLAVYDGWLARFGEELKHLPWTLTWEGSLAGKRVGHAGGYISPQCSTRDQS